MAKIHVATRVNGNPVDLLCEARQSLVEVLRDSLGLTGAKEGCGDGNCGACAVTLNGRLVTSCLVLAVEAAGQEIVTIEGLASGGELHPVQQAFLEQLGFQCGFCTPGMIMSARSLLEREPHPSDQRIRHWLSGNLCRCTGYDKIVLAVQDAAARMAEVRA